MRCRQTGFTLMEIVVVMIIISLVAGAVVMGAGALPAARVKAGVRRLVSIIKYAGSHARGAGVYTRVVLDLDGGSSSVPMEEMPPQYPDPPMDPHVDTEVDPAFEDWPAFDPDNPLGPVGAEDDGYPFRPPEYKWEKIKGRLTGLRAVKLNKVTVERILFPELDLELMDGKAAIVFSPEGFTHEAFIYLYAGGREGTIWIRPWGDPVYFPGHMDPQEIRK